MKSCLPDAQVRWAIRLIYKLWNIVHQIWINRNAALHKPDSIDKVQGIEILNSALTSELQLGLGDLPTVYASYFLLPLPSLLSRPSKYKNNGI